MAAPARAGTVAQLLRGLVDSDPGRPRITWYDDAPGPTQGERIELSARVLANWTAKAANLLVDELDVEPGDRVALALPTHWRAVYWLLAAWCAGAEVVVAGDEAGLEQLDVRVLVVDAGAARPAGRGVADHLVAVSLPALARRWQDGSAAALPDGAVDEAAVLTGQPDVFEALTDPDPGQVALRVGDQGWTHGELLPAARAVAREQGWDAGARVLTSAGPGEAVPALLAPLCADGSVVLVRRPGTGSAVDPLAGAADGRLGPRSTAERVTSAWPPAGRPASRP